MYKRFTLLYIHNYRSIINQLYPKTNKHKLLMSLWFREHISHFMNTYADSPVYSCWNLR